MIDIVVFFILLIFYIVLGKWNEKNVNDELIHLNLYYFQLVRGFYWKRKNGKFGQTHEEMLCIVYFERNKCYLFLLCKFVTKNCVKMFNNYALCRKRIENSFKKFFNNIN